MESIDLHQGRNPEKVARDHEALVVVGRWSVFVFIVLAIANTLFG